MRHTLRLGVLLYVVAKKKPRLLLSIYSVILVIIPEKLHMRLRRHHLKKLLFTLAQGVESHNDTISIPLKHRRLGTLNLLYGTPMNHACICNS